MAKEPVFSGDKIEAPSNLLSKTGKVKPAGLLTGKKPVLKKFGSTKSNGLPRKNQM